MQVSHARQAACRIPWYFLHNAHLHSKVFTLLSGIKCALFSHLQVVVSCRCAVQQVGLEPQVYAGAIALATANATTSAAGSSDASTHTRSPSCQNTTVTPPRV